MARYDLVPGAVAGTPGQPHNWRLTQDHHELADPRRPNSQPLPDPSPAAVQAVLALDGDCVMADKRTGSRRGAKTGPQCRHGEPAEHLTLVGSDIFSVVKAEQLGELDPVLDLVEHPHEQAGSHDRLRRLSHIVEG